MAGRGTGLGGASLVADLDRRPDPLDKVCAGCFGRVLQGLGKPGSGQPFVRFIVRRLMLCSALGDFLQLVVTVVTDCRASCAAVPAGAQGERRPPGHRAERGPPAQPGGAPAGVGRPAVYNRACSAVAPAAVPLHLQRACGHAVVEVTMCSSYCSIHIYHIYKHNLTRG